MTQSILTLVTTVLLTAPSSDEIERILAKYDDIKYSHQYGGFYRSLFVACDASDLVALNANKNDSIATQSAWEIVAQTVPTEKGPQVYRPDPTTLAWFVGFIEGRNRVAAPEWWRTVVLDARANRRNNIYPGEPQNRPYHRAKIEGVTCPEDASVIEKDRVVTYTSGMNSIVIPEELLRRADSGKLWCNISCAFTGRHCFVAIHGDVGYSHDVACIDRETNKILWKTEACGCWWGGASGIHESWVTVVPTNDGRVFVFGSASIGFYAHGFDASNGKTVVQFSNNY